MTTSHSNDNYEFERLVDSNMGLLVSLAQSFKPKSEAELDEFIQHGRIGLWKALKDHEPSKGKLSTIAWRRIRWEIIRYMRRDKCISLISIEEPAYTTPDKLSDFLPSSITKDEESVLELRCYGYSFKEIISITGLSRAVVSKLFLSAAEKIKKAHEET